MNLENLHRAHIAEKLIVAYATQQKRTDELAGLRLVETLLTDMLADLMHYAHVWSIDFEQVTRVSGMHFSDELAEAGRGS